MKQKRFIKKVTYYALFMAIMSLIVMTGCGGEKSTTTTKSEADLIREQIEINELKNELAKSQREGSYISGTKSEDVVEYANNSPLRFFGEGAHSDPTFAIRFAEAAARATAREAIETRVISATNRYADHDGQFSGDDSTGENVTDQGLLSKSEIRTIAEGSVENSVVVKSGRYIRPNKEYRYVVCIEVGNNDLKALSSQIVKQISKRISDEDKLKIRYEEQKYREEIENELQKMRQE